MCFCGVASPTPFFLLPPHPGLLTLRHGLLLQGGWRSSTAAGSEAAGQPGMPVGVVQQFVIALLWVQYRSPSVPVIGGHGNDAVQTRGSALVSSVHEKYRKEGLPWSDLLMAMLPSSVIIYFLRVWEEGSEGQAEEAGRAQEEEHDARRRTCGVQRLRVGETQSEGTIL